MCFWKGMQYNSQKGYENNTMTIAISDHNMINFNMSDDKKKQLHDLGYNTSAEYFKVLEE